ncbi:MAG: glucosamine-6-phosphate deaminase [Flavisolibacter sp.]
MSRTTADFIADCIMHKPASLICLPSGESPTGTLQYLVQYGKEGKVNFSQCKFMGLDEWGGIDTNKEGSTRHYLFTHFLSPLKINSEQYMFFDPNAQDLDEECRRIDEYIKNNGPIDVMLVGIGMNGHIGLNEPGCDFNSYSHHGALDAVTKVTAQKYFSNEQSLEEGLTLGIMNILESRILLLIANGDKKSEIISKALESDVSNRIPASIVQKHNSSYVFLDKGAASKLSQYA